MISPPSVSRVYEAFHPGVKRWIYGKGWTQLREVQEEAGRHILFSDRDVIVAAPTAGGKTEAAFLPVVSRLAEADFGGIGCLCISPLKALINDQYERLSSLFESVDRPLHAWHGDIAKTRKDRALESRAGTLLITPESLEAMFVRRSTLARAIFGSLAFVVVDELHAFIGTERGRHVQSLLHRLETMIGRTVRRIALSATLGDMKHAANCLRPGAPESVAVVKNEGGGSGLELQLRGYVRRRPQEREDEQDPEDQTTAGDIAICEHLFKVLRGSKNLVFANSRQRTEQLAALLRRACEQSRVPCEFFPHHGNLSAEIRQEAEARLKEPGRPATVVCTSTLELGIDVGAVKSVAQVGVPPTVASLRQRLGRSGRGTDSAVLRVYVEEDELTKDSELPAALRLELVESIAMVELLLRDRFSEPQNEERLHLSTLIHQVLALIAERGGIRPAEAFRVLCATGPFRNVSSSDFAEILRAMGKADLILQMTDGVLVAGIRGEREIEHYSFFAVFQTPDEYRIVTEGKTLGSLPLTHVVQPGEFLIFAGRWWEVLDVDEKSKTITVRASRSGKAPLFFGSAGIVDDRVRAEMFRVLSGTDVPRYLNPGARQLLAEGRATFAQYGLASRMVVQVGDEVVVIPWLGDRKLNTLQLVLTHLGFRIARWGAAIRVADASKADVLDRLRRHRDQGDMSIGRLLTGLEPPLSEKYESVLSVDLALKNWASASLDPDVGAILRLLLDVETPSTPVAPA